MLKHKHFKRGLVFLFLTLLAFPLLIRLIPTTAYAQSAAAAQDLQARQMFTMVQCLQQINIWSRGNKVTTFEGMLTNDQDDYIGDDQIIVVGLDRDSGNGVATCEEVLKDGYKAFAPNDTLGMRSWLLNQLTGSPNFNDPRELTVSGSRIDSLIAAVRGRLATMPVPSDDLQRARFLPLVNVCYDHHNSATSGDYAFHENGVYYYQKTDDQIRTFIDQTLHINKNDGNFTTTHAKLGDIELGFYWSAGLTGGGFNGFGDGGTGGSDFYPIGSDLSRTKGYTQDAIIDCGWVKKNKDWLFAGITDGGQLPPPPASVTPPADATSTCDDKAGELAWIMCPVLDLTDAALGWVNDEIEALLEVDSTAYQNPQMHQAWGQIRNIAYIILVPMMLIMVIGTALGVSFLDAYTVKRAMPRMIIAVIFIALSWEVTSFLITLSNDLGAGVLGIITHPFNAGTITLSALIGPSIFTSIFGLALFSIGIVLIIWFFGTTLLLFAAVAFIILLLRQLFIIALVLAAPLAILAWIFPNNDRLWKTWWSMFSKLLLMFPLIMAIIALGRVFAKLIHDGAIGNAGLQGGLIKPLAIIIVWMIGYAFIPWTFKFAGGLFGTMTGLINDRSKGLFDRAKQGRADKARRTAEGNMFKGGAPGGLRDRLNTVGAGAANINKAGVNPLRMRTNMRTALHDAEDARVGKFAQESASFNAWNGDDAKVWAARFTSNEDIGAELARRDAGRFGGEHNRARREEAISQIKRSQREVDNGTFQKARLRAQAKTGTGYQRDVVDENGVTHTVFDAAMMMDDINATYGDDRNGAGKALAEMRTPLQQSGQMAGGAAYGTWAAQMENLHNARNETPEQHVANRVAAHNAVMDSAIDSVSPGQAIFGKPSSAAALGQAHFRRIEAIEQGIANGTNTADDLSVAVANAAGIADAIGQGSAGNATAFVDELYNREITIPGQPAPGGIGPPSPPITGTVRSFIDSQMGGNAEFVARRSTMSAQTQREAQQRVFTPTAAVDPLAGGGGGFPQNPV